MELKNNSFVLFKVRVDNEDPELTDIAAYSDEKYIGDLPKSAAFCELPSETAIPVFFEKNEAVDCLCQLVEGLTTLSIRQEEDDYGDWADRILKTMQFLKDKIKESL